MKLTKDERGWICLEGENAEDGERGIWTLPLRIQAAQLQALDAELDTNPHGIELSTIPAPIRRTFTSMLRDTHGLDVAITALVAYVWSHESEWLPLDQSLLDTTVYGLFGRESPGLLPLPDLCQLKTAHGSLMDVVLMRLGMEGKCCCFTLAEECSSGIPPFSRVILDYPWLIRAKPANPFARMTEAVMNTWKR